MFDARIRPLIDPPLNAAGRVLARAGISANAVSVAGGACGAAAGVAVAHGAFTAALALIVASRLCDGLDGGIARATQKTDFGAYLDVVADYVFYAAVPLGFAVHDPRLALPAAMLLGGFLLASASFLGFAILAEKRGLATTAQGQKGFFYLAGLAEGTETIAVLVLAVLQPAWFPWLAWGYAAICVLTAGGRLASASRLLR